MTKPPNGNIFTCILTQSAQTIKLTQSVINLNALKLEGFPAIHNAKVIQRGQYQNFSIVWQIFFDANTDIELQLFHLASRSPPPHLPILSLRGPNPSQRRQTPPIFSAKRVEPPIAKRRFQRRRDTQTIRIDKKA